MVNRYQLIAVGDVSSRGLAKTRMAKSVLDAGWGMLKRMLQYKGEYAGRSVSSRQRENTTRSMQLLWGLTGPTGKGHARCKTLGMLGMCCEHDRDENAARNILYVGLRSRASVCGERVVA